MIGVGILGAGYWGPKHVRNFSELGSAYVAMVSDLSDSRLEAIRAQGRGCRTTTDYREMFDDPEVEAIVIATPVATHARFAREALLAGKHVLVEKPLASSSRDCSALVEEAAARGRVLMVGHTFLFNPAVLMLRDLIVSGELGQVYHVHADRLNLGLFQRDINVLWDLAPHDLSILHYVLDRDPIAVGARGVAHVQPGLEAIATMHLEFPDGISASIHASWLDPQKVRRLTVIGSKKMVVYDDVEAVEKLRIYDKGADRIVRTDRPGEVQLTYRSGGISLPAVPGHEPLRLECQHFIDCIRDGVAPRSDGTSGLKVVRALEAADTSIAQGGVMVPLPATPAAAGATATVQPSREAAGIPRYTVAG